jgi:DNA invertase Pin-like site-specific DNA recombinase
MGHLLGYARVSTTEQNPALQHDALHAAGCYRIFTDRITGALDARPELDRALDQLRPGDTPVVWKLDRLGRSLRHLIDLVASSSSAGSGSAPSASTSTPPPLAASWCSTCSARWPSSSVT